MQLIINASVMSSLEIPVKCRAFSNFFYMLKSVLPRILEPSYFLTLWNLVTCSGQILYEIFLVESHADCDVTGCRILLQAENLWNQFRTSLGTCSIRVWILMFLETVLLGLLGEDTKSVVSFLFTLVSGLQLIAHDMYWSMLFSEYNL